MTQAVQLAIVGLSLATTFFLGFWAGGHLLSGRIREKRPLPQSLASMLLAVAAFLGVSSAIVIGVGVSHHLGRGTGAEPVASLVEALVGS